MESCESPMTMSFCFEYSRAFCAYSSCYGYSYEWLTFKPGCAQFAYLHILYHICLLLVNQSVGHPLSHLFVCMAISSFCNRVLILNLCFAHVLDWIMWSPCSFVVNRASCVLFSKLCCSFSLLPDPIFSEYEKFGASLTDDVHQF
jgi:hypothetical protein